VVTESIKGVVETLVEAIVLVFLVMFLFLQNFRATVITTMTVPVVLLGTFGILAAFGFSINTLTMFGMVLAIGLLVDDAIVVVENVERVMSEEGLSPKEATKKSMGQIQGALVGIALVLSAVLLPMAFFSGSTGVIYKQFSITIVSAMALSVLVALIFTPALCATMLKAIPKGEHGTPKRGFFGWFNRSFDRGVKSYERGVGNMLTHKAPYLLAYLIIVVGMIWLFTRIPTAFLPEEDQGVLFAQVQTPAGSSAERTQVVIDEMRSYLLDKESSAVASVFTVNGFNFAGRGQSSGLAFIMLKPWDQRDAENSVFKLAARAQQHFFTFRDAMVFAFAPPAVLELGNATGFDVFLQDRAGIGHDKLMAARNQFLGMAAQSKVLYQVRPNGLNDEPQYQLEIDDEKASALGLTLTDINSTLSIALGSSYVNDFIDRGRVKKVYVQGQPGSRMSPEDIKKWYVRNAAGTMVPFSAFAKGEWIYGAPKLSRYNGVEAMEILGAPAPGYSTGDAMAEVEALAKKLPAGVGISWTGLSYEERLSGSQAPALYALSLLMVFLCLAALYESWSIPIAVMLVVPLGIIGALLATSLRGLSNDVYFQVGLLTTIGLAAKNAILIVEFAKELHEQGHSLREAAIEACRMRLRPIIMTSLAFVLGVVPLAISTGAGSGSQHAIGTGVIGGMITATVLAIFWVPLFFVTVSSIGQRKKADQDDAIEPSKEAGQ
jgi:multidrug efflux pump